MATNPDLAPLFFTPDDLVHHQVYPSRHAVYMAAHRGQIPGKVKRGRRLLFDRAIVLQWLREKGCASAEP